jgi:hypothetical protein
VRAGILRTYVATLRRRRDAPFPSQIRARQRYRMKARKTVKYAEATDATMRAGEHASRIDTSQTDAQEPQ